MKVSIITVTFNSASTIEETLKSVISQTHPDKEYIVVDGASSDETLSIIEKYRSEIQKFISEKDKGLYYAINKGIAMATGDVIAILHSDDLFIDETVLSKVVSAFKQSNAEAVYGDLYYVDQNNTSKIFRRWKSGAYSPGMFLNGWMPPHPSFFAKREVYTKFGNFNTELKSAADYEIMLRFIHKNKIGLFYLPDFLIKMRAGGQSNASLKNRLKANAEDRLAWKLNGLNPRFYTLSFKPLRKIFQFFMK